MNRTAVTMTFITLGVTLLWLVLMIASTVAAGPLDTFEQVLAHISNPGQLYFWNYLNAGLVTLAATGLFASLFQIVRPATPTRAGVGLIFIPVYCVINLICYFSQITIVPALARSLNQADTAPAARMLLEQLIHEWPLSTMAFFNALAYAVLAIPSILYGAALMREKGPLGAAGWLLLLSGVASIAGLLGISMRVDLLGFGTLLSGVLFIAALPLIAVGLRD